MEGSAGSVPLLFENVSLTFANGTQAVETASFSVAAGQFASIVGPSGCGKSTLLRIASGLLKASTGQVTTGSSKSPKVGFIFQEPTLMPWATVFENVALPLRLQETTESDLSDRVTDALSLVGLEAFADAYPRELSGGMKMRVSFARALVSQPDVLLLDEPFAALDEFTRAQFNDDLLRLCEHHSWTTLFVTHSIQEATYLSDKILVMSARPGRITTEKLVPFPHPRSQSLRASHGFLDFVTEVSRDLKTTAGVAAQ